MTIKELCERYIGDLHAGLIQGKRGRPKKPATITTDIGRINGHIIPILGKKRVRDDLSRVDSTEALLRFEEFESRIERLEAEAELAGPAAVRRPAEGESLEARFDRLAADEDVERELARIKARKGGGE